MHACNRRTFMTRVVLGTVALTTVGRALADPSITEAPHGGCDNCRFYTPAPGARNGFCAFAGKTVDADDGCAKFTPATRTPTEPTTTSQP